MRLYVFPIFIKNFNGNYKLGKIIEMNISFSNVVKSYEKNDKAANQYSIYHNLVV